MVSAGGGVDNGSFSGSRKARDECEGKVSRLTTVWDGAMLPLEEVKTLVALSIE